MKDPTAGNSSHLESLDLDAKNIGMGGNLEEGLDETQYQNKMKQRKEVQVKRLDKRQNEKGLIIVFCGNGKGKTTAALGMAIRTLGHKEKVAIIQFIKGGWNPGEAKAFKSFNDLISWHAFGEGFTWETQNRAQDKKLVQDAWEKSLDYLKSKQHKLVILDEINVAIKLGYISLEEILTGVNQRPPLTHVVLTGRGAPKKLIEKADLVTEMNLLKHPFKEQGVKAQKGIEF